MTLIIDTGPLVALGDAQDVYHAAVLDILENEPGRLIIPAPVSAEADYLIRKAGGSRAACRFLEDLAAGRFLVECLTKQEYELAISVDKNYSDLDLGLADLSVVVLALRFRTTRLLTFDERDFRVVKPIGGGFFTLLPADA